MSEATPPSAPRSPLVGAPADNHSLARKLTRIVGTLALGTAGGAACDAIDLPLAWMIGAMCACTIAAMAGAPLLMSQFVRAPMVSILGVMLGSSFSPQMAGHLWQWWPTILATIGYVTAVTGLLYIYFRRICGFDPITAYFSAAPGGLNEMVVVGGQMGGDERRISLVHGARVLLVVLIVPFGFMIFHGYQAGDRPPLGPSLFDVPPVDILVLAACAGAGAVAAKAIRMPAAFVTGPMLLSAIVHLTGITDTKPPAELTAAAQVVIGTVVGCRFSGVAIRTVLNTLAQSVGATTIMLVLTLIFSLALAPVTDASFAGLVLALSPGGLAEMSLIALALSIDAAFVSSHHIFRIVILVIVAPALYRRRARKRAAQQANAEKTATSS